MSPDESKPPIPQIDETKPVVWTAEDASRFLTSAIHEAQKPLAEALKQRPITSRALTMLVGIIIVAALAIALILSGQLEKTEKRAELAQQAREEILTEKAHLQAQTRALEDRLNAIQDRHDDLTTQVTGMKQSEEKHRRTQSDLARFRQHNELLRDHISGLEREKASLTQKLMKALAIEHSSEEIPLEAAETAQDVPADEAPVEVAPAEEAGGGDAKEEAKKDETEDSSGSPFESGANVPVSTPAAVTLSQESETSSISVAAPDEPAEADTPAPEKTEEPEQPAVPTEEAPVVPAPVSEEQGAIEDMAEATEEEKTPAGEEKGEAENPGEKADEAEAGEEQKDSFEATSAKYGESLADEEPPVTIMEKQAIEEVVKAEEAETSYPEAAREEVDAAVEKINADLLDVREREEALTEERKPEADAATEEALKHLDKYATAQDKVDVVEKAVEESYTAEETKAVDDNVEKLSEDLDDLRTEEKILNGIEENVESGEIADNAPVTNAVMEREVGEAAEVAPENLDNAIRGLEEASETAQNATSEIVEEVDAVLGGGSSRGEYVTADELHATPVSE